MDTEDNPEAEAEGRPFSPEKELDCTPLFRSVFHPLMMGSGYPDWKSTYEDFLSDSAKVDRSNRSNYEGRARIGWATATREDWQTLATAQTSDFVGYTPLFNLMVRGRLSMGDHTVERMMEAVLPPEAQYFAKLCARERPTTKQLKILCSSDWYVQFSQNLSVLSWSPEVLKAIVLGSMMYLTCRGENAAEYMERDPFDRKPKDLILNFQDFNKNKGKKKDKVKAGGKTPDKVIPKPKAKSKVAAIAKDPIPEGNQSGDAEVLPQPPVVSGNAKPSPNATNPKGKKSKKGKKGAHHSKPSSGSGNVKPIQKVVVPKGNKDKQGAKWGGGHAVKRQRGPDGYREEAAFRRLRLNEVLEKGHRGFMSGGAMPGGMSNPIRLPKMKPAGTSRFLQAVDGCPLSPGEGPTILMGKIRKENSQKTQAWHYPTGVQYAWRDLFQEVVLRAMDYLLQVVRADGMHNLVPVLSAMAAEKVLAEAALVWLRGELMPSQLAPCSQCGLVGEKQDMICCRCNTYTCMICNTVKHKCLSDTAIKLLDQWANIHAKALGSGELARDLSAKWLTQVWEGSAELGANASKHLSPCLLESKRKIGFAALYSNHARSLHVLDQHVKPAAVSLHKAIIGNNMAVGKDMVFIMERVSKGSGNSVLLELEGTKGLTSLKPVRAYNDLVGWKFDNFMELYPFLSPLHVLVTGASFKDRFRGALKRERSSSRALRTPLSRRLRFFRAAGAPSSGDMVALSLPVRTMPYIDKAVVSLQSLTYAGSVAQGQAPEKVKPVSADMSVDQAPEPPDLNDISEEEKAIEAEMQRLQNERVARKAKGERIKSRLEQLRALEAEMQAEAEANAIILADIRTPGRGLNTSMNTVIPARGPQVPNRSEYGAHTSGFPPHSYPHLGATSFNPSPYQQHNPYMSHGPYNAYGHSNPYSGGHMGYNQHGGPNWGNPQGSFNYASGGHHDTPYQPVGPNEHSGGPNDQPRGPTQGGQ
jgi:hypothetical protein